MHFEKIVCGKSTQKEKETKRKSLSVKTGPDLTNKAQPRKKKCTSAYTVACGLMGLMWALGWLGNEHSQKIEIGAKHEADINQLQKQS